MDTHILGPRNQGHGAVLSHLIVGALVGDTADGTVLVMKTDGATPATPLFVRITGQIVTTFNGTTPTFSIVQTDLDGSNSVTRAQISSFSAGKFEVYFFLTADKIFNFVFAEDVGEADATFADGVSNTTTTYTSATAAFVAADVGKVITGTDIPTGTTIASRTSGTSIVLSQAATGSHTGNSFTIVGREPATPGTAGEGYYALEVAGQGTLPQNT